MSVRSKKGNVVAFVPMRSGSKGIADKNIKIINNKPLFYYMLSALDNSKYVNRIVVSTDSMQYHDLIYQYFSSDKVKIIFRSKESASDEATTEQTVKEFIYRNSPMEDFLLLAQVTSPVITTELVDEFLASYLKDPGCSSQLSVVDLSDRFFWSDQPHPRNYTFSDRRRRQDLTTNEKYYVENGALYINHMNNWKMWENRLTHPIKKFVFPKESLFEVDDEEDWALIENILRSRKEN